MVPWAESAPNTVSPRSMRGLGLLALGPLTLGVLSFVSRDCAGSLLFVFCAHKRRAAIVDSRECCPRFPAYRYLLRVVCLAAPSNHLYRRLDGILHMLQQGTSIPEEFLAKLSEAQNVGSDLTGLNSSRSLSQWIECSQKLFPNGNEDYDGETFENLSSLLQS